MSDTIQINDVEYVRKEIPDGMEYCVIRSYGAGVFTGYVKEQKADVNGVNVTLIDSRRIWYWDGACSLSQLAVEGSKAIDNCKIAMVVPEHFIANVIEIIPMSNSAAKQIQGAPVWKK